MSVTSRDPHTRASRTASSSRSCCDPRVDGDPGCRRSASRGRSRRRLGRRLLAAVAALALICAGPVGAAQAAEATPTPEPTPSPTLSGTVQAWVAASADGVASPHRPLTLTVAVRNGTDHATAAAEVSVYLGTTDLRTRTALSAWLKASPTISTAGMSKVGTGTVRALEVGDTDSTTVSLSPDDKAVSTLKPGIHPLAATVRGPSSTQTVTGVVTVPDDDDTTTPVGVVVPITAGPQSEGLLSADRLATLTASDGALTAQLDAVLGSTATLAVDPSIPASIRALGTAAPRTATQWLELLDALPNERFALQFGDADVAVQARAGLTRLLAPLSLQAYMSADDFARPGQATPTPTPTDMPTPDPSPTADADGPDLPSLAQLQNIGPHSVPGILWPFAGSVRADVVPALGKLAARAATDAGAAGTSAQTLIPSSTVGAPGTTVAAHGTVGAQSVLVDDSIVSDALETASTEPDPDVRAAPLSAAVAQLTLARQAGVPLLVTTGRSWPRDASGLSAAVGVLARTPGVRPAGLKTLSTGTAARVTVHTDSSDTATSTHAATFDQLRHEEDQVAQLATVLDDPTNLTGPQRAETLQLIGGGWLGDTSAWETALAAHGEATSTTLASVDLAPSSPINLTGTAAQLGFGVRNDLPWPVHVALLAQPDNLRLEVAPTTDVTAHPASTTRVAVPVRARVGNGAVTLSLHLQSPTGVDIGTRRQVAVNVHADWETIGLIVLGALVALFLVGGIVRTVLARRRRAASADTAASDTATDSGASR